MKKALSGYWKIAQEHGLMQAIWSFYSYYYTKYKLKKIKKEGKQIVYTHGCKLKVIPEDEGLSAELLLFGSHEPDTTEFISNYLKKGMNCVDVGANIGYYSTLYSKIIGNEGTVLGIEPSPRNFEYLKNNLEMQNISNYKIFNCACGDVEGKVNFQIDSRANKCMVVQENSSVSDSQIISVPVSRLDDIINNSGLKSIDFIKIDVEGYEWNAIRGALETIRKFKPTIQIEIHFNKIGYEKTKELLKFFKDENYEVIFHDIGLDEKSFFKKKKSINYNLDDFIEMIPITSKMNSYKIIIKYISREN